MGEKVNSAMSLYELAILGSPAPEMVGRLKAAIAGMVDDFGLSVGSDVVIHDATTISGRDKRVAFAAVYFGGDAQADIPALEELIQSSASIIPCVSANGDFALQVPKLLTFSNGLKLRADDTELIEVASALLECAGLLRRQRRVFVSYRRTEARAAALQLHDLLTGRGFDVFLDTHGIRPGDPFQEVLWHRLVDSDLMIMLDTPTYFESRWTREEIGRARAKDIQVLRVIWPAHTPSKMTDLAETIRLDEADLAGEDGPIVEERVDQIILQVELLRSRAIAARYLSITGKLRADVEKFGGSIEGIGAHRAIALRLLNEQVIWAYPIIGVPTAETLNDVVVKAQRADQSAKPVLVYDHIGIQKAWGDHIRWLNEQIQAIRLVKVSEAAWDLAGYEG
jgi:hypothetical protein